MAYGFYSSKEHLFKDCFICGVFDGDWIRFRNTCKEQANTLVFYPHGSLALSRDAKGQECKIHGRKEGGLLLDVILYS